MDEYHMAAQCVREAHSGLQIKLAQLEEAKKKQMGDVCTFDGEQASKQEYHISIESFTNFLERAKR